MPTSTVQRHALCECRHLDADHAWRGLHRRCTAQGCACEVQADYVDRFPSGDLVTAYTHARNVFGQKVWQDMSPKDRDTAAREALLTMHPVTQIWKRATR